MLKTYIHATNYLSEKSDQVLTKVRNEEGEVASWLVLSAGLALAAFAAKDTLAGIISDLAAKVGTDAGGGGGTGSPFPPNGGPGGNGL